MKTSKERYAQRRSNGKCTKCGTNDAQSNNTRCQKCANNIAIRSSIWRIKLRLQVLLHYSEGLLNCKCCGINDFRFLQIDHVNGGGRTHRTKLSKKHDLASHSLYKWLVDNNYPKGFEVLCGNCNMAKHIHGVCPHKTPPLTIKEITDKTPEEIWHAFHAIYADTISKLEITTIDEDEQYTSTLPYFEPYL